MPTTDDQTHHADPPPRDLPTPGRPRRRRPTGPAWASLAAGVACLACLLPVLAAGGLAAGLAALVTDVDFAALLLLTLAGLAAAVWYARRRKVRSSGTAASCGCVGCREG